MSEASPTEEKLVFVYLVREVSEGNVYIPIKKEIMRVRDSCLAIVFEIDRFVIYFLFSLLFQIMFLIILVFSKGIAKY